MLRMGQSVHLSFLSITETNNAAPPQPNPVADIPLKPLGLDDNNGKCLQTGWN